VEKLQKKSPTTVVTAISTRKGLGREGVLFTLRAKSADHLIPSSVEAFRHAQEFARGASRSRAASRLRGIEHRTREKHLLFYTSYCRFHLQPSSRSQFPPILHSQKTPEFKTRNRLKEVGSVRSHATRACAATILNVRGLMTRIISSFTHYT